MVVWRLGHRNKTRCIEANKWYCNQLVDWCFITSLLGSTCQLLRMGLEPGGAERKFSGLRKKEDLRTFAGWTWGVSKLAANKARDIERKKRQPLKGLTGSLQLALQHIWVQ